MPARNISRLVLGFVLGGLAILALARFRSNREAQTQRPANQQSVAIDEASSTEARAVVTLNVSGIKQSTGVIKVALFSSDNGFPNHELADHRQSFDVTDPAVPIEIDAIAPGSYAVAVYHDVDSNGVMNRALAGYPTEPYGFSNNARATFGPPDHADAVIELVDGKQTIAIQIR